MEGIVVIILVFIFICFFLDWRGFIDNAMPIIIIVGIAIVLIPLFKKLIQAMEREDRERKAAKEQAEREARQREEEARWRADEPRRRREEAYQREQEALQREKTGCERILNIVADSQAIASELSTTMKNAESWLAQAEYEFQEGAFAPFWDAVEHAAYCLAVSNSHINQLNEKTLAYKHESSQINGTPPPFQLTLSHLPKPKPSIERMSSIIRRAQKNINFATIYEQRKTNKLLIAGFSTLNQTIGELPYRLESSFAQLASSISEATNLHDQR